MRRTWTVVVPVKATGRGKSRLDLPPDDRRALARALALDTVAAVLAAGARVLAVTEDRSDAAALRGPGVQILPAVTVGLNQVIAQGVRAAGDGPVAVLPGDLPGLDPADLAEALDRAGFLERGVCADRDGTGTTLLTAGVPADLRPRYGPQSYRRHLAAGHLDLGLAAASTVRADVDTLADLVMDLDRVGPATRAAWSAQRDPAGTAPPARCAPRSPPGGR